MPLSVLAFLLLAGPTTDLTFVRHSETVANATGKYNSRTLNAISDKGQHLIRSLTTSLLKAQHFDEILVSPSPRSLKTIVPYLKASGQKATIWPLLYECCTGGRPKGAHATKFSYGERIKLPAEFAPYFVIKTGWDRLPNAATYNAGLAQVEAELYEFRAKFGGKRVLLVGHSGNGGQLLHALTGKWIRVENAKPIRFQLQ